MNENEIMTVNAGKTYVCPFCYRVKGGYWSVYSHALFGGCYRKNGYFRALADAGWWCLTAGIKGFIK